MIKVLVVDDDAGLRLGVSSALKQDGSYEVIEASNGQIAVEKVKEEKPNIVLLDVDMPVMNGLAALKMIKQHDPSIIVIILTAYATIECAVQAVKDGAYDYISKPIEAQTLLSLLEKSLQAHQMITNLALSAPTLADGKQNFIGRTVEMQKIFHLIHRLSKVDTPVLIRGASGTGKELVARAIHMNSSRKNEKFIAINCSAIPENLFESELFGHEKGSFTGADARKIGKLQYAEGGTIFLDEIGDMPLLMQVKLLRVLQEHKFTPVGSNREQEMNVRVVAATNRNLEEMITKSEFREDLFYRLNVIPIFLPELKQRVNDIEHLIHYFIDKFNKIHNRKISGITSEALSLVKKYAWPGNIRELENMIEHAFVMESGDKISINSLPEKILQQLGVTNHNIAMPKSSVLPHGGDNQEVHTNVGVLITDEKLDFSKHKEMFEKEFITKALKSFHGRINQTALHANIPKKTLLRKIEKYGINPRDYFKK